MTKKRWILLVCAVVAAISVVVVLVRPMLQTPLFWERHAAAAAGTIREYSGTLAEPVSPDVYKRQVSSRPKAASR